MASLNEGRKKSNFGAKGGAGTVDIKTSRSKVQDPANTTRKKLESSVNPKKGPPKGSGRGFGISKDSAARYAGNPDKVQQALTADDIRSRPGAETTPKNAASNILSGGRKPSSGEELIGTGAKSGRGQRYRQTRPSEIKSTGIKTRKVSAPKPEPIKQSDVSKRAERFRQSFGTPTGANPRTGAPTYRPLATTSDLPKGVGGRAPSSKQYSKVKISDLTPTVKPTGASISTKVLPSTKSQAIPSAPTKTKVELPKLTLTRAPARSTQPQAPKPSFKVRGAKGLTSVPQLPTTPKPLVKPSTSTTIRRKSGNAGPSSKLDAGKFTPPKTTTRGVTTSKGPTTPDLGRKTQIKTRAGSVSYKPNNVSTKAGPLSMAGDLAYGGFVGYDAYQKAKARGQSDAYAYKQAATQGGTTAAASAAGSALGRKIGSKLPGPGWVKAIGTGVGDWVGTATGGYLGQTSSPGIVGASKSDKKWMKWANRSVQKGTPTQSATSKSGNRAIVRDAKGKERVGYRAYKDGKAVYKHGNDPSSLQYTSSNPLERIGRTVGSSGGLGPVSDWVKGYYSRKDTATRTANVAAQRSRASK